jgi:protein arginine N-methyltransferase 2
VLSRHHKPQNCTRMLSCAELLLGLLEKHTIVDSASLILQNVESSALASADVFLESKLRFVTDKNGQKVCLLVVDGEEVGVMMGWERTIMHRTVEELCRGHPNASALRVLNVGFGLGIVSQVTKCPFVLMSSSR